MYKKTHDFMGQNLLYSILRLYFARRYFQERFSSKASKSFLAFGVQLLAHYVFMDDRKYYGNRNRFQLLSEV